jgi:hypothetical protein
LGEWAAASGDGGGWVVATDLLIFIRMLTFLTADFGCVTKKIMLTQNQTRVS